MERTARPSRNQRRGNMGRAQRRPLIAIAALLLVTGLVLVVNQRHSGDPLKVRRELRKF